MPKHGVFYALRPLFAVGLGLCLGLIFTTLAGESPWNVFQILFESAFGSLYDFGMTLFYMTPLLLTGLSVAFAFRAGLFNIGAEGQLAIGALSTAIVGIEFSNFPPSIAPAFGIAAGFLGGAVWGGIAGWLRAYRGSHEVITTIMLNFVAAGLVSFVTLYIYANPESQSPETAHVSSSFLLNQYSGFDGAPVSFALPISVVVLGLVFVVLSQTVFGFRVCSVGENENAAKISGMNVRRVQFWSLFVAGGLAGLVGVGEVLGNAGNFRLGFSPGFGFVGIAVALLGRGRPLGILLSAFLFAALHKGTTGLDLETETISRDLSVVLQAFIILSVAADGLWDWIGKSIPRKRGA